MTGRLSSDLRPEAVPAARGWPLLAPVLGTLGARPRPDFLRLLGDLVARRSPPLRTPPIS